jgi:feruloyl-CoA synthase
VQDVVIAGINEAEVGLMVFPRIDDCRQLAGLPPGTPIEQVLRQDAVRQAFQALLDRLWRAGTGGASRPARMLLLAEPPSLDGELTDKGSVNQRNVLSRRSTDVQALYAARRGDPQVFFPASSS